MINADQKNNDLEQELIRGQPNGQMIQIQAQIQKAQNLRENMTM